MDSKFNVNWLYTKMRVVCN